MFEYSEPGSGTGKPDPRLGTAGADYRWDLSQREYVFDMGLALVFGVIGYIAHKTQFHVTSILIGVILGPLFEQYLLRTLRLSQGDPSILFSSTIGNILWVLLVVSLLLPLWRDWQQRKAEADAKFGGEA